MVEKAVDMRGDALVDAHLKSRSANACDLGRARAEVSSGTVSAEVRTALGKASRTKETPWFKDVTTMEKVACEIVGPHLQQADESFRMLVEAAFTWARNA